MERRFELKMHEPESAEVHLVQFIQFVNNPRIQRRLFADRTL